MVKLDYVGYSSLASYASLTEEYVFKSSTLSAVLVIIYGDRWNDNATVWEHTGTHILNWCVGTYIVYSMYLYRYMFARSRTQFFGVDEAL